LKRTAFAVDERVEMLLGFGCRLKVSQKSMGLGRSVFANSLDGGRPDISRLLGDRFEMSPAAAGQRLFLGLERFRLAAHSMGAQNYRRFYRESPYGTR